eukprot:CAMPEP_0118798002 /NCGR_PEP_ID=MMETSP1161-20130426/447_1 /TAXON_ID=249345 /ORGANISM="Picochlorum oklahomensis, Strain CCMP2329" /LENGTH=50 /DNA_ID=CAMNT_0006725265 /DNA_START=72 /DNA_END=224 /DNA_ORIENTATION=-
MVSCRGVGRAVSLRPSRDVFLDSITYPMPGANRSLKSIKVGPVMEAPWHL